MTLTTARGYAVTCTLLTRKDNDPDGGQERSFREEIHMNLAEQKIVEEQIEKLLEI